MAKSNSAVTPTSIKPNLQILPQNGKTFSCFLQDHQSNLRIDSEPAVLTKLKSYMACSEIGWLGLKYNTSSSVAQITSLCLAETHSFHKFCLYITQLRWTAYTLHITKMRRWEFRSDKMIDNSSFELDSPYLLGSEIQPSQLVPNSCCNSCVCVYIYTCIYIALDLAHELRLLFWVLISVRGATAGFWITKKKFRRPVKDLGIR